MLNLKGHRKETEKGRWRVCKGEEKMNASKEREERGKWAAGLEEMPSCAIGLELRRIQLTTPAILFRK